MRVATRIPQKASLARWFAFGTLCGVVAAACLIERFPLLQG